MDRKRNTNKEPRKVLPVSHKNRGFLPIKQGKRSKEPDKNIKNAQLKIKDRVKRAIRK